MIFDEIEKKMICIEENFVKDGILLPYEQNKMRFDKYSIILKEIYDELNKYYFRHLPLLYKEENLEAINIYETIVERFSTIYQIIFTIDKLNSNTYCDLYLPKVNVNKKDIYLKRDCILDSVSYITFKEKNIYSKILIFNKSVNDIILIDKNLIIYQLCNNFFLNYSKLNNYFTRGTPNINENDDKLSLFEETIFEGLL
jgi:hypothetical protein